MWGSSRDSEVPFNSAAARRLQRGYVTACSVLELVQSLSFPGTCVPQAGGGAVWPLPPPKLRVDRADRRHEEVDVWSPPGLGPSRAGWGSPRAGVGLGPGAAVCVLWGWWPDEDRRAW